MELYFLLHQTNTNSAYISHVSNPVANLIPIDPKFGADNNSWKVGSIYNLDLCYEGFINENFDIIKKTRLM